MKNLREERGFQWAKLFGIPIAMFKRSFRNLSADGECNLRKVLLPILSIFVLALAWSGAAWADTADPVGFCPPPGGVSACTTGTGIGGETIAIGSTTFVMEKNGSGTSISPWDLLVAVPNSNGVAPTINSCANPPTCTSTFFTLGSVSAPKVFTPGSSGDIYDLFGLVGSNGSLNVGNLFGPNTTAALGGGTAAYFDVFEYSFTGPFGSNVAYTFTVGGSGLAAGTWLAGYGGSPPFTTPNTTAGLVNGPTVPSPEPGSLMMLGAGLLGLALLAGRRPLTA